MGNLAKKIKVHSCHGQNVDVGMGDGGKDNHSRCYDNFRTNRQLALLVSVIPTTNKKGCGNTAVDPQSNQPDYSVFPWYGYL